MSSDRGWAYGGVALGLAASLGANVLDVVGHADPGPWQVIGAAFWPLALLMSSEVLARKRWGSASARAAGVAGVLIVAAVAAWISYGHVHDLLVAWGEPPLAAALGPLAIDGLMVVSSLALVAQDAPPLTVPSALVGSAPVVDDPAPVPVPVPVSDGEVLARPVAVPSPARRRRTVAGGRRPQLSDELLAQRLVDEHLAGASARAVSRHLRVSQQRAGRILDVAQRLAREAS